MSDSYGLGVFFLADESAADGGFSGFLELCSMAK